MVIIYTYIFYIVMKLYSKYLMTKFKILIIVFEILLIARVINIGVFTLTHFEANSLQPVDTSEVILYEFINRNIFTQIFIKVMFLLKRVEYQMSADLEDDSMIFKSLRRLIVGERIYILILFVIYGFISTLMYQMSK